MLRIRSMMPCSMVMWIDFLARFVVTHSFVGEGFSPLGLEGLKWTLNLLLAWTVCLRI